MNITLSNASPSSLPVDVLVVGVGSQRPLREPLVARLDQALGGTLLPYLKQENFKAKEGQTIHLPGRGRLRAKRLVLIGLGDKTPGPAALRLFAIHASRAANSRGGSLALAAPGLDVHSVRSLAEGIVTGAYRYTRYLTGDRAPKHELKKATIVLDGKIAAAARAALSSGQAIGEAINFTRDLVNTPPNDLTATKFADLAIAEAKRFGVTSKLFDKKAIAKLGMPLLLAVNRGSTEEPRFFHLTYKPTVEAGANKPPRVVFVGKGLTFDSGGLCLKTADGMLDMKADMAGAAATVGIVLSAARLGLPIEVHGVVASTDNMSGGDAYRPGDVFPSRDGKTVEIINTDAEGRLVLADALAYARELEPDYLIDHATLTGACMVALGSHRAGLFSNDDGLREAYQKAAQASGENFWYMPLDEDLRDQLKSYIADLKHTGSRYGGSITAALFLREFVGECRWLHLDIAGPAFQSDSRGAYPKGGTGFGVITAVEFLEGLASVAAAPPA